MDRGDLAFFEGVGLHSGVICRLTLRAAPPGSGIGLRRVDRPGTGSFPLIIDGLRATDRRTVVGAGDATVSTVEHLLAALSGLGIWDAALALEGPEVPILDGSALPFVEALAHLRPTQVKPLKLTRSISIEGGGGRALAEPSEDFAIACSVRFDHPAIGEQHAAWDGSRERFIRELAPARTFGFVEEVATLRQRSLIAGGSLDCALVYGPEGSVNTPRFSDEVVRHKLLDAVGDLALIGRPLLARITLERPGHGLTTALTRAIKQV